jgi:hypothetical protein
MAPARLLGTDLGHQAVQIGAGSDVMGMSAVRAGEPIPWLQCKGYAYGDSFLADARVNAPLNEALFVKPAGRLLKMADSPHACVHLQQRVSIRILIAHGPILHPGSDN